MRLKSPKPTLMYAVRARKFKVRCKMPCQRRCAIVMRTPSSAAKTASRLDTGPASAVSAIPLLGLFEMPHIDRHGLCPAEADKRHRG